MKKQLMEFWVLVTADKKKAGVLGALVLIALVMWARAMIIGGGGPAKTSASSARAGGATARAGEGAETTEKDEVRQPAQSVRLPVRAPLERNLFELSERYFPLPSQTETTVRESPKYPVGNDEKLHEQELARQAALTRSVRDEAARLKLRSTMIGASPIAVIETPTSGKSGEVVRIGQEVAGFKLLKVHSGRVVLEKVGVIVELSVPKP